MTKKITDEQPRVYFDCSKCPAFCCAIYERVQVTRRDINRLAKYFGLTVETATERYTKMHSGERVLRRKKDPLFGQACQFLDHETRGCTIYHARPAVCREYPDRTRCAYYDLLQFEREQQDDINVLPLVQITFRKVEKKVVGDQHGSEKILEWKNEKQ
ncbi:MAG TPA: YkgJ family cysteine cluster protein [Pyrinomonadaceae bacterium]|jgi:Fe-S-cluster containining protein|nr:YkgJ family cysteine cluster protein [Pyrinomonadaceae bacterium]